MQFVEVVVGGQYGSEAKGHVTAQLVEVAIRDQRAAEVVNGEVWNIRVAGPNAGHTVYDRHGQKYAFRHLPVGAVVDEDIRLYIAPGSEVDIEVLRAEIEQAEAGGWEVRDRLYISRQATVIEDYHKAEETRGQLVERVGSTGKGIGAARADRIMRQADTMGNRYANLTEGEGLEATIPGRWWRWAEPEDLYATDQLVHDKNQHLIIEGTQGYGLSLRASGHYPQVTSSDCRSIDFLAMAGVDPTRCSVEVTNWVVARVFPIRVAGNSGPMEGETTWEDLGLEPEKTTVTQKTRRVGAWDPELVQRAVQANGGHNVKLVITMLDQIIPELKEFAERYAVEADDIHVDDEPILEQVSAWIEQNASPELIGAQVAGFTFSPTQIIWTSWAMERHGQGGGGMDISELLGGQGIEEMLQAAFQGAMKDAQETGIGIGIVDLGEGEQR